MHEHDEIRHDEYEVPAIIELGDAAELTLGRPMGGAADAADEFRIL